AKSISSIPTILTFYRFLLHPTPTTEPYTLSLHDALPISHEGVPHLTGQETGLRRRDARPPAAHRVERARRPPRPTERATQLHLTPTGRPEGLVRDHVRPADFGVHLQPQGPSERAVPVEAGAAGQEVPVAELEDVLYEEPRVDHAKACIARELHTGRADDRYTGPGEPLAVCG